MLFQNNQKLLHTKRRSMKHLKELIAKTDVNKTHSYIAATEENRVVNILHSKIITLC